MMDEKAQPDSAVGEYFERCYPDRRSALATCFRHGERERLDAVRQWLPDWENLSVWCPGVGDGEFLSRVMRGRPGLLRITDLVPRCLEQAARRLHPLTERLETAQEDVFLCRDDRRYDIVLCLGLSDYHQDWKSLVSILAARTSGMLVLDFPRQDCMRSSIRRLWLAAHGIRLHCAARAEIDCLFPGRAAMVRGLNCNWLAGVRPGGQS